MDKSFGAALKDWRSQQRMSQLDLGLTANVSARHISFLETGRSKPSRAMVMNLCESLEMPREARNVLLNAAGYSPAYRRRELNEADMVHVRDAVDWMLERHDPYPALALDRHWTIVKANRSAGRLIGASGLSEGDSLLEAMADIQSMKLLFDNWQEVAQHMMVRLRTESAHLGGDAALDSAAQKLASELSAAEVHVNGVLPAVIPARYRANGMVLSFFSTLAQFGTAEDIALAELRIEMMFPADDVTRDLLLAMEAGEQGSRSTLPCG